MLAAFKLQSRSLELFQLKSLELCTYKWHFTPPFPFQAPGSLFPDLDCLRNFINMNTYIICLFVCWRITSLKCIILKGHLCHNMWQDLVFQGLNECYIVDMLKISLTICNHLSVKEDWDNSHFLAVVSNVEMKPKSAGISSRSCFPFFWLYPICGAGRSHSTTILNIVRDVHSILHKLLFYFLSPPTVNSFRFLCSFLHIYFISGNECIFSFLLCISFECMSVLCTCL